MPPYKSANENDELPTAQERRAQRAELLTATTILLDKEALGPDGKPLVVSGDVAATLAEAHERFARQVQSYLLIEQEIEGLVDQEVAVLHAFVDAGQGPTEVVPCDQIPLLAQQILMWAGLVRRSRLGGGTPTQRAAYEHVGAELQRLGKALEHHFGRG